MKRTWVARGLLAALMMTGGTPLAWAQSTASPPPPVQTPSPLTQSPTTSPATTSTPAPATPAAPQPATPAPAPATTPAPAAPSPAPATPAPPAAPSSPAPSSGAATPSPPDTSISQTLDLPARPALVVSGKSSWDDGFKTIMDAFAKLNDAMAKASITPAGKPLAVFTATDDNGFSFSAEMPLDKAPDGKSFGSDITVGETPSGKAMRFQHRGSYEEIDSTYEAITAYLDEKGLEARNMFAEEYLDQVKTPDDANLEVDIYVFLK